MKRRLHRQKQPVRGSGDFLKDMGYADPDEMRVKFTLANAIALAIEDHALTQDDAAKITGLAQSDARAIADATERRVSAINFVESAVIIDASRDPIATRRFDDLITEANIFIEPVTGIQAQIARGAYRDFGKGSGHPAKLNFGDCFAYALAKAFGEPLLFKGGDFAHTDIVSALLAEL